MIVHGGLTAGRFLVWGETPLPPRAQGAAPRSRRARKAKAGPLPFAAGAADVAAALPHVLTTQSGTGVGDQQAVVWLPTVQGQPLASSPLIAEPPESEAAPSLEPWTVPVAPLTTGQLLDLLASCMDRDSLDAGVLVGKTLAYWTTALRFAAALVGREQFLPDLEQAAGGWRACWKPVLTGIEGLAVNRLAQAMPAACRALGAEGEVAPQQPAAEVLRQFLTVVVDELVRSTAAPATVPTLRVRQPRQKTPAIDSVHDQWLHALRGPEGTLRGKSTELTQLAEQVRTWDRPVAVAARAPFRLCFRLEEPPANGESPAEFAADGTWMVRYFLQAQDDPSLLLSVADAWEARGQKAAVLRRGGFQPREYLLQALGQAASQSPPIEASLKTAQPAGFETDATGAHQFLTDTARLLRQAGFGVLLPAWWTGKGTRQRLSLSAHVKSPPMQGGSGLRLEDLVNFDWRVALGEHTLTLRELETLARLKSPLVKVRGQWVQVSEEEIETALAFWKKQGEAKATVRDLIKMELGAAEAPAGLAVTGVEATGWIGDLLQQLEGKASFAELPPPAEFQGNLRPYQVRGYAWLAFLRQWGLGACLADDMGLGKTIQALALIQRDWEAGQRRPVLLVCPMSVVGNWMKEAERFTPGLPVLVHHGLKRARGTSFAKEANQHALVLSSYSLLHRDLELLQKIDWAGVVLDEAQNVKNPNTKQAQAARSLHADYRIALTGTPVENHVGDLWSLGQFLNPGLLGSQTEFRRAFFVPIQVQHDSAATERLKRLTGPFLLRRLKTDKAIIADLPAKQEMKVFCNLTREQASLYAAVVDELGDKLPDSDGIQRKGMILGALSKLKQVCNHPAHFLGDNSPLPGRSGKLARLTEMLEEVLEAGDRALIFTQFTEMGDQIQQHLRETLGQEVLFLHGSVPRKQRDRMVARFQSADGNGVAPRLFLLSLKAGGTGLNLTAANHVFHFDRWWNPAVEDQATDRAFRIGQKRDVQVHKFVCVGTLEERIDEMISRKKDVAARVVGSGEAWLTELSNEQLKDLLTLRPEAVGD
jgi:SNF2 family DNA or RNA helicase